MGKKKDDFLRNRLFLTHNCKEKRVFFFGELIVISGTFVYTKINRKENEKENIYYGRKTHFHSGTFKDRCGALDNLGIYLKELQLQKVVVLFGITRVRLVERARCHLPRKYIF